MTCVIHCYAVLAIVSNSYPPLQGRLPTRYSPVRNSSKKSKLLSSAFYLHVLGTPPAFILSQDQTLHLISSSIVTASRCLSYINLLTFVVSCNVSISCSVFKELPHCPFEQCSMSISSSRFLCQHVFLFFLCFFALLNWKVKFHFRIHRIEFTISPTSSWFYSFRMFYFS